MDKTLIRQDVLRENNTAQADFGYFLENLNRKTKEIKVTILLNGHLNLEILPTMGFMHVQSILFRENGQITGLDNIPKTVKIMDCQHNLLEELKNLPEALEELRVAHNVISYIDFSTCKNLLKLYLSYNSLSTLSGLSESLVLLYCDHNNLLELDLSTAIRLKTLHCEYNTHLVLKNIPDTIQDAQYPERMLLENRKPREAISSDYIASLKEYFKIKGKYETEWKVMRKEKKKTMPKCKGCEKNVGMIFSSSHSKFQVRCKGNPPCDWNIVLHRGSFQNTDDVLYTYLDDVENMKESVIKHKMATLFYHMGEKKAKELFDDQMKAYTSASSFLKDVRAKQDDIYFNIEKQDEITMKQKQINDALENVKKAILEDRIQDAAEIQYKIIFPLSQSIQKMQYEIIEMENRRDDDLVYLIQEPVHYTKAEINLGQAPSVGG